jgi:bifunctional pyridoxal-dependent enzyme with beta-cystathionase and maltose regulon repressor activities
MWVADMDFRCPQPVIDHLISDMARTAVNVNGSMTAGLITSKVTKQLDTSVYRNSSSVEEVAPPLQNF